MHALTQYQDAKTKLAMALSLLCMIGKKQNSTDRGLGKLHSINTKVTVYYQPTDGANNYHSNEAFDQAFSKAVVKRWDELSKDAVAALQEEVDRTKHAAAAEYEREFGKQIAA